MDYNKYEKINSLKDLLEKGAITEEEFEREKAKVLSEDEKTVAINQPPSKKPLLGMEQNTYLMLMHLSQFAGWIIVGLGFIIPVSMWLANKDQNETVDLHGKNILNFTISYFIYSVISILLVFVIIGIPLLIIIGLMLTISIIVATIKASNGKYWRYPLIIEFVK